MFGSVLNIVCTYINKYAEHCVTELDYHSPQYSCNNIYYQILFFVENSKESKFPCPTTGMCHANESYLIILKISRVS